MYILEYDIVYKSSKQINFMVDKIEEYKEKFIDFLLKTGALKVFDDSSDDRTL